MTRPDLRHLWDHRGIIHRLVEARDAFGDVTQTWSEQSAPPGKNCRPSQTWSGTLVEHGPGEAQNAPRSWFLDRRFGDVRERDVLEIVSGPEIGTRHRILSVTRPTAPMVVHHLDVMTEAFREALTPAAV